MVNVELNNELSQFLQDFKINPDIISFCINRDKPRDNLYWKGQETYLDFKIRFLAIPFWLELCNRENLVPLSVLLNQDNSISLMEQILHYSEEEEMKLISFDECMNKCSSIRQIKSILTHNSGLLFKIKEFLEYNPKYKSLRRGNFLIFFNILICKDNLERLLPLSELLIDLLICGCIIDDLHDIEIDINENEDNLIIELGNNSETLNQVREIFAKSNQNISIRIPELMVYLEDIFAKAVFKYLSQVI